MNSIQCLKSRRDLPKASVYGLRVSFVPGYFVIFASGRSREGHGMKNNVHLKTDICSLVAVCLIGMAVQAETVYYALENVVLGGTAQMTGIFSWTYTPGDAKDFV